MYGKKTEGRESLRAVRVISSATSLLKGLRATRDPHGRRQLGTRSYSHTVRSHGPKSGSSGAMRLELWVRRQLCAG
jgi:hypothetical protein